MNKQHALYPYLELTKPRIVWMVLITASLGWFWAGTSEASVRRLLFFLIGLACTTGGAATLNNYLEWKTDQIMDRTKHRVLPSGILTPSSAKSFGIFLVLTGVFILCLYTNLLTAFLCLLACFLYVFVYTPMKQISWWNTSIGAIPGAIPPMAGWTAASGELELGAWLLFLIMFIWQHPHFYAIAWMFKEDYRKANFKMLPVVDPEGTRMFRHILFYSALLMPAALAPVWAGLSGKIYLVGAFFLTAGFFGASLVLVRSHSGENARNLLKASVFYLPLLLIVMITDLLIPL